MKPAEYDIQKLQRDIQAALNVWHEGVDTADNLLEYLGLVQERRQKLTDEGNQSKRLATNGVLLEGLRELGAQNETAAQLLRWRFLDRDKQAVVANRLKVDPSTVSRQEKAAIRQLAQIILQQETAARETNAQTIEAGLPPPTYSQLFGVEGIRDTLIAQLLQRDGPPVIAVSGLGGIGKTALADQVTRRVIRAFAYGNVFWVRLDPQTMTGHSHEPEQTFQDLLIQLAQRLWPGAADQLPPTQRLARVRHELKTRPHLIIIDNLESESDTAYLLHRLNDLARPGKFLVTSRSQLGEVAAVYDVLLPELALADAAGLIRHHAAERGFVGVAAAADDDIQAIYDVVGGNPHFLKLVVGLLQRMPLRDVLAQLRVGREDSIEKLYRHIYWQTWQLLSANAQNLLQIMPLVADSGGTPDYLQTLSGIGTVPFWPALHELQARSLVEVRGNLYDKLYGIHQLTRTFIHTEIIQMAGVDSI